LLPSLKVRPVSVRLLILSEMLLKMPMVPSSESDSCHPYPAWLDPNRRWATARRNLYGDPSGSGNLKELGEILKPEQWQRLIQRLGEIPTPKVPAKPSAASLPAKGKQPSGD
jgi:hypothetical protein